MVSRMLSSLSIEQPPVGLFEFIVVKLVRPCACETVSATEVAAAGRWSYSEFRAVGPLPVKAQTG